MWFSQSGQGSPHLYDGLRIKMSQRGESGTCWCLWNGQPEWEAIGKTLMRNKHQEVFTSDTGVNTSSNLKEASLFASKLYKEESSRRWSQRGRWEWTGLCGASEANGMILLSLVDLKVFSRRMKLSDQHFNRIILITLLRICNREGKGGKRVRRLLR